VALGRELGNTGEGVKALGDLGDGAEAAGRISTGSMGCSGLFQLHPRTG